MTRAASYHEAAEKAIRWRDSPSFLGAGWERVEVCYYPQVNVKQAVKGPWAIDFVRDGAPEDQLE